MSSVALAIFADRRDRRIKSTLFDMSDIGEFNRRDRRINMIKSPGVAVSCLRGSSKLLGGNAISRVMNYPSVKAIDR